MAATKKAGASKFEMLNELQIAEIREVFTLFDKNTDGLVNTQEIGMMVRALKINPTEQEVIDMMKDVDPNNTGSFDQNALISWVARHQQQAETLEEMIEALNYLDQDGNGKLPVSSFRYSMTKLGEMMAEHEVEEILTDLEITGEYILIEDFAKLLMSR